MGSKRLRNHGEVGVDSDRNLLCERDPTDGRRSIVRLRRICFQEESIASWTERLTSKPLSFKRMSRKDLMAADGLS